MGTGGRPTHGACNGATGLSDLVVWLSRARSSVGPDKRGKGILRAADLSRWCAIIVGQVLCAIGYLHTNGILHLGICPANIILSGAPTSTYGGLPVSVAITNEALGGLFKEVAPILEKQLGWNRIPAPTGTGITTGPSSAPPQIPAVVAGAGPARCAAPEALAGMPTTASDLYAAGCVLHLLLFGQLPPPARSMGVEAGVPLREAAAALDHTQIVLWSHPPALLDLCRELRAPGASCRPTASIARIAAARVADAEDAVGLGTYVREAGNEDEAAAFVERLIERWRCFSSAEIERRTAVQRLATSTARLIGAHSMGVAAALTAAQGLLVAEPCAREAATEHAVAKLLSVVFRTEIAHCPAVRDALNQVVPTLVSAATPLPPPSPRLHGADEERQPAPLAGCIVVAVLQEVLDMHEFAIGAARACRGGLNVPVISSPLSDQAGGCMPRSTSN